MVRGVRPSFSSPEVTVRSAGGIWSVLLKRAKSEAVTARAGSWEVSWGACSRAASRWLTRRPKKSWNTKEPPSSEPCLGSMANQLGLTVQSSLPTYLRGRGSRILEAGTGRKGDDGLAMFLHVDFALLNKDVDGYLAFIMDIASAERFVEAVRAYLGPRL